MGKKKEERKLILVGGRQGRFVPATHVRVGAMGWWCAHKGWCGGGIEVALVVAAMGGCVEVEAM